MKINMTMLIETIKSQAIGESLGKVIKGKDVEAIKEIYGVYLYLIPYYFNETKYK